MDRYGRPSEDSQSDLSPEWIAPGTDTSVEEHMRQLGLGVGAESYPKRPDQEDCIHYLRTGSCGYGLRCRYNHPHPRDRVPVMGAAGEGGGRYPERVGQPVCQYYMRTGACKFGASCKFHHPRHGAGSLSNISLNYYGYPLRPGENECSYYMKTGQCKFGAICKFHHPQPAGVQAPTPSPAHQVAAVPMPVPAPTLYPTVQSPSVPSSQQYGVVVARPPLLHSSYVQGPYGSVLISADMVPLHGWSTYAASITPIISPGADTQSTVGSSSIYGFTQLSASAPPYTGAYQYIPSSFVPSSSSQKEHPFPERPGQLECPHYMKTGDCKFGSSCRYHHPRELIVTKTDVTLSASGLPLRPGAAPCTHYAQRGICKFGPACKFDHPMGTLSYSPSASSLADMPVAPYPVGSLIGTLAPSSSSADLRPELISGFVKDSVSTRMSSSVSTSSGSVGPILSESGSVPHSGIQQSGQSSGPSIADGSSSNSAEALTSS